MTEKKTRVGIFGGSFDPVHSGHIYLAKQLKEAALLDKVIFVPNYINPFKLDSKPASAEDRFNMLSLALENEKDLSVSDIELKKGRSSYTIDTLEELQELHPDWELVFITGSDSASTILTWHRGPELVEKFNIIAGARGEYSIDSKVRFYPTDFLDISSTQIRTLASRGESVKGLLPEKAEQYLLIHGLYAQDGNALTDRLLSFVEKSAKPHRFAHTIGVRDTALELAEKYGADKAKTVVAAIFHDAYRSAGNLEHGEAAAKHIKDDFGVTDEEVLNALRWHTTGRPGMGLLEKVLKIADMIEPNRDYPGVEELRNKVSDDVDITLLMLMKHTKEYVIEGGGKFDEISDRAIADLEYITERKKLNG